MYQRHNRHNLSAHTYEAFPLYASGPRNRLGRLVRCDRAAERPHVTSRNTDSAPPRPLRSIGLTSPAHIERPTGPLLSGQKHDVLGQALGQSQPRLPGFGGVIAAKLRISNPQRLSAAPMLLPAFGNGPRRSPAPAVFRPEAHDLAAFADHPSEAC